VTGHNLAIAGAVLLGVGVLIALGAVFGPATVGRHRLNKDWEKGLPKAPQDPTADTQMDTAREAGRTYRRRLAKNLNDITGPEGQE
jgi:hypothetical protein